MKHSGSARGKHRCPLLDLIGRLVREADHLFDMRDFVAASALYLKCLQLLETRGSRKKRRRSKRTQQAPDVSKIRIYLCIDLADCARAQGDFEGAEQYYWRGLRDAPRYSELTRRLLKGIGDCRYNTDSIEAALRYYKKAANRMVLFRFSRTLLGQFYCDLGDCARRLGDIDSALQLYLWSKGQVSQCRTPREALICADAVEGTGEVIFRRNQFPAAQLLFEKALQLKGRLFGPEDPGLRDVWYRLIHIFLVAGKTDEAIILMERLVRVLQKFEPDSLSTARFLNHIAQLLASRGRHKETAELCEQASAIFAGKIGFETVEWRQCLLSLSNSYCWLHRYADAERVALRLLEEQSLGGLELQTARAERTLGTSLAGQGRYDEALSHHQTAVEMFTRIKGSDDSETVNAREHLDRVLAYAH